MRSRVVLAALAALAWPSIAAAVTITPTGDAVVIPAPASVVPPALAQDGVIHVFDEQQGFALTSDLEADMTVPYTTYNPPGFAPWTPLTTGRTLNTITTGTMVNSFYIHFDPATFGGSIGSVTFDEKILAVMCEGDETTLTAVNDAPGDTLGPSNYLGNIATTYPDNAELLGIEDGPDRIRLFESTIEVAFGAGSPGDRVRVLTIPGSTATCGDGALDPDEVCDDGDIDPGDGCFGCVPETCSTCTGAPSTCTPITTCVNADGCCAPGCTPTTDTDCLASCTAKKIKLIDKKKSCLLKLFSKGAKAGVAPPTAKLDKCAAKFAFQFFKEELKGGCQTTGDAAALEAKVDAFVADVVSELDQIPTNDQNPCRAQKLACVVKYDHCSLALYAKAAKTGFINPVKQAKCDTKFSDCWTKAEILGGCETLGDAAVLKAKDDTFIDDVTCELQVCIP